MSVATFNRRSDELNDHLSLSLTANRMQWASRIVIMPANHTSNVD